MAGNRNPAMPARGGPTTAPARPEMMGPGLGERSGMTEPMPITAEMLATMTAQAVIEMAPVLIPPGVDPLQQAQAAATLTGLWRQNVQVTALWCINEPRNAWIHVANIGWKKLFNSRDGAFTTLVTLASQAKQTGQPISFREENDGMIYEIYLW